MFAGCNALLEDVLSSSKQIKFACMRYEGDTYSKTKGNAPYLYTTKQIDQFVRGAFLRMTSRKVHEGEFGSELYTLTKWDKLSHFIIPINAHDLLIVFIDDDKNILKIIEKTIELKDKFQETQ